MKAGSINKEWHDGHRMPKNPTRRQRVAWHAAHAAACGCRPVPPGLAANVAALASGGASQRGSRPAAPRRKHAVNS